MSGYLDHRAMYRSKRWRRLRLVVFNESGWKCKKCKRRGRLELDHKVPIMQGGSQWARKNLQALCRDCHIEKSSGERMGEDRKRWKRFLKQETERIEAQLIENLEVTSHDESTENQSPNE